MAVTKKIIGRLPIFYGSYYPKEGGWARKNRVTLFGSEFESKIENNTYAPATYDETTNTVTFNTDYWDVVSNGTDAWLASDKIEALGYYVENPEWMRALVDANGHILAGIKDDGSVEWSIGVPTPVKEYVTDHLAEIMADITEGLATKVDKEDGKSLVDSEFAGGISYIENSEFTAVYLDKEERILFGVNTDGNFYFGCGVPKQIVDYIKSKFDDLNVAELKAFLIDFISSDTTLLQYLNTNYGEYIENPEWIEVKIDANGRIIRGTKLDGTTFIGKLSSPEIDNIVHNINNLDYYNVTKRNIGTVEITIYSAAGGWEQIAYDSTAYPYDESDTYSVGEVCNVSEDTAHSYKATARNKGIYPCVEGKETVVAEKLTLETALAAIDSNIKATFTAGQIIVFLDTDDIIEKWELQDDSTWKRISPYEISDPECRHEITLDMEDKIVSYRKEDGTKVENVGIESPKIATDSLSTKKAIIESGEATLEKATLNSLELTNDGMTEFQQALKDSGFTPDVKDTGYVSPYLPKYGTINIKSETFYLESHPAVSSIDDVVPIQDYEDTSENNDKRMSRAHYYVKGTLTDNGDGTYTINSNSVRLMHFASEKVSLNETDNKYYASTAVTRKNGICYYADTLVNASRWTAKNTVLEGYTVVAPDDVSIAEGDYKMVDVEVTQITGVPCLMAWNVEALESTHVNGTDIGWKMNHNCICDIDFGAFFSKDNYPIMIKHQGRVTVSYKKRGYRLTTYKADDFKKKDKIKVGEMIRLSKYNAKAYPYGILEKEPILFRIFIGIWNTRPIVDRFDWDGGVNGYYHGAAGNLKVFPVKVLVNGEFYGIYFFGEPKDEKNCILDGEDESGMYLQGSTNGANCWGRNLPYDIQANYSDEQGAYTDEYDNEILSPDSVAAMENWTHFMQGRLYKGSDDNEYNITELTDVEGTYYVTSTLDEGQVVEGSISTKLIKVNRENVNERIDVIGFMDYLICLQVFQMGDNFHNNMILYSNSEKRKLWPFFYDVNDALSRSAYNEDYIQVKRDAGYDLTVWDTMIDLYWDDIVNRYASLRNTVLNKEYINAVYEDIISGIPNEDYASERDKWDRNIDKTDFASKVEFLSKRLAWLDENYFIK